MLTEAIIKWRERTTPNEHRPHLGASVIGHECMRHLWYHFRWVQVPVWDGRVLRMFNTGKREEARVIEELRGIGADVWADDGSAQFSVSTLGGHFGGSMDAVIKLPWDSEPCVLEIKTHNAKSFADLKKQGMKKSKLMHWSQMQIYMHLAELKRGVYFAVCKDTDEIHTEEVEYDWAAAEAIVNKARTVLTMTEPPLGISTDPSWFACKFCQHHSMCHGTKIADVNCRTCAHSTPVTDEEDAKWTCGVGNICYITVDEQRKGCKDHLYIPSLLKNIAEPIDGAEGYVVYRLQDGEFVNGPAPNFSSLEIKAAEADPGVLSDNRVQQIKQDWPDAKLAQVTAFDDMESDDLDVVQTKDVSRIEKEKKKRVKKTLESLDKKIA